jgi:tight adherence protein B
VTPTLLTVLIFLAGVLLVLGTYSILFDVVLRDRERLSQRIDDEFRREQRARAQKSPLFKDLAKLRPDADPALRARAGVHDRLATLIEQAGMAFGVGRLVLVMAAAGAACGTAAGLLGGVWFAVPVAGLPGALVPVAYLHVRRRRRLDKMLGQLPDAFELIGRLIRAGQTITQAFQGVADEFQPPLATEFAYCYEQQNLGLSPDVALRDLARRVGLVEMKIFVLAVLVQRQTGGNLAELIDNLATIVRERFRIRGKIRILTAEGRMEATVLLAMPPVVLGLILLVNRGYGMTLFEHPNLLWGMAGLMLVGLVWIRRIVSFDF